MRNAILSAMLCAVLASTAVAGAPQTVASKSQPKRSTDSVNAEATTVSLAKKAGSGDDGGRRCAFLGRFGSFTVIGAEGTAAYRLGNGEYIADLKASGQDDPNWWLYRPLSNGDPWTEMWAFARRPQCGKYTVMRFSNGAWHRYEQTDAWGRGLGESIGVGSIDKSELLEAIRTINDKLKTIQPDNSPSLKDLEKLIKEGQEKVGQGKNE